MSISETELISRIEEDLRLQYNQRNELIPDGLGNIWSETFQRETSCLVNPGFSINVEALKNFRKLFILLVDIPIGNQYFNIRNILDGLRRGQQKVIKIHLEILERRGYTEYLRKYPSSKTGNPYVFNYKGYSFTWRWLKNIYYLGMCKEFLEKKLGEDFIVMDIGSGYGIFSYLMKNEFPRSTHILVDLPQQLVMAHYFLFSHFPEAKIATYKDIASLSMIDKTFMKKFDFILLPWHLYSRVAAKSLDLLTNFISFAEMGRRYFDFYINNEPFLSAKHFFTINRFVSAPKYDNGLTVLDYRLEDFRKIHFGIFPLVLEKYKRQFIFFYVYFPHESQVFEFIGAR